MTRIEVDRALARVDAQWSCDSRLQLVSISAASMVLAKEVRRLQADALRALDLLARDDGWDEGIALLRLIAGLPVFELPSQAVDAAGGEE